MECHMSLDIAIEIENGFTQAVCKAQIKNNNSMFFLAEKLPHIHHDCCLDNFLKSPTHSAHVPKEYGMIHHHVRCD